MRFAEAEVTRVTFVPLRFTRGQGQERKEVDLAAAQTRGSGSRERKERLLTFK